MIEYLMRKQKITLLFFLMITITGFFSFLQLPRQEIPEIIDTSATINTSYPGASAEKVEQNVTKKIEQCIKEVQGIKNITSESSSGNSFIEVEAQDGVTPKLVWEELRKKVRDAEADLPGDANKPEINDDTNRNSFYTIHLTVENREQLYKLREIANTWRDQLRTVPGVIDVTIGGIPKQEVRIDLDVKKIQSYDVSSKKIVDALKNDTERYPIGDLALQGRIHQLKLPESYKVEDLNRVIITRSAAGSPVYLRDIGQARLTTEKVNTYVYHNQKPAIVMGICVEKGLDAPSVQQRIDDMLQTLEKDLPVWAKVEPVFSQNKQVSALFKNLKREMLISIIAVLFVCTLGLNFVTALMVAMAIPISMAVGLLFLPSMGITINSMSVYGMIIVLGILVDDAVVVNDNIDRRLSRFNEPAFVAAANGTKEVALSIITATMATIFSFGPLLFLPGNAGDFIKPIPVVIIFTMLASMAMALTIVPIFRYWHGRRYELSLQKPTGLLGNRLNMLARWYADRIMPAVVKKPLRTGIIGVVIATLAYGLIPFTPINLFPTADRDELPILVKLPQDSDIEETHRLIREMQQWIGTQEGVKEVEACAGARADLWYGRSTKLSSKDNATAMIMAKLDTRKVVVTEVAEKWLKELKEEFPGVEFQPKIIKQGPSVGEPIALNIYGDDIVKLREISQKVKDRIAKVPGVRNIQDNFGIDRNALEFQVNKGMMDQGLVTNKELTRTLRLLGEGLKVGEFDNSKDLIDIKLYAEKKAGNQIAIFQNMMVENMRGEQIPLSQIGTIKPAYSIRTIPHRNLSRVITITGDVHERTASEVMSEITQVLSEINMPEGYRWESDGETSKQADIFINLAKLSIIVVFLIIIQIAIQFYSIRLPLLVMSTVYLAIAGGIIGLFVTRTPLGFMSMLGFVSLSGIVVRNGIVLIDFIEEARKSGIELVEAVILAGEARLRPILLTSATAIAGLIPLALSGDPLFKPLATTIIFGLLLSTILTLIVVPSLYIVLERCKARMGANTKADGINLAGSKH